MLVIGDVQVNLGVSIGRDVGLEVGSPNTGNGRVIITVPALVQNRELGPGRPMRGFLHADLARSRYW